MNTRLQYEYRDASSYHWYGEVVVAGEMTAELWTRIRKASDELEFFIADQVGLPEVFGFQPGGHQQEPERERGFPFDRDDDHCWHRWLDDPGAWSLTTNAPTDARDVAGLVAAFESANHAGWKQFDPVARFGL